MQSQLQTDMEVLAGVIDLENDLLRRNTMNALFLNKGILTSMCGNIVLNCCLAKYSLTANRSL